MFSSTMVVVMDSLPAAGKLRLVFLAWLLITATRAVFSFPLVPPPILNRPVQYQPGQVQNSQSGVQAAQSEQTDQSGESFNGDPDNQPVKTNQTSQGDSPTFDGCGLNRDAAIMKAELLMTQALGDKTVSGHRTLNNDQYARTVTENSTMLTNRPVTVLEQWGGSGRVCVRITP